MTNFTYPHTNYEPVFRTSYSTQSLYRSCARKLELRKFIEGPREEESLAAAVGQCMHRALQNYMVYGNRDLAIWELIKTYPIELNNDENNFRSIEACYATLQSVFDSYSLSHLQLANIKDPATGELQPAVEVPFEINVQNFSISNDIHIPVIYSGLIDAIMYDVSTGNYIVIDIKTTRNAVNDASALYVFDDQCVPYGLVLEAVLGTDHKSFTVSYMHIYIDIKNPKCHYYEYHKSESDVLDWARTFAFELTQIKEYYNLQWFPRNGNSCMNFKRACEYIDYCIVRDPMKIMKFLQDNNAENSRFDRPAPWVSVDLNLGFKHD